METFNGERRLWRHVVPVVPSSFAPNILLSIRDGKLVDKVVDDAVIRRYTQLNSFAEYFRQRVVRVLSVE